MKSKSMSFGIWRRLKYVMLLLTGLFSLMLATTVQAAEMANTSTPINITEFVPCAAEGVGEEVTLSGHIHDIYTITLDNNGGFHYTDHINPQNVSGTGQITGDKYQATGGEQQEIQISGKIDHEDNHVKNIYIIGQGSGSNFRISMIEHITVHPDGTITRYVNNFSVDCK